METYMADRLVWRKPQLTRLTVSTTTGLLLKDGSTEDIISHANDWPAGVVITKN